VTFTLQPKLQKSVLEHQHWRKDDARLCYTVLYRSGWATFEEEPVVDLDNLDPHGIDVFTIGTVDAWETSDSCSDDWSYGNIEPHHDEQERIQAGFYDGGHEFLEAEGWTLDETELVFLGELELTEE